MQNIQFTSTQSIPFNQLVAWRGNVRRTGSGDGIESLAASIDAHGLLQPIVVRNGGDGWFPVIAGHRRFLALQHMVENGKFTSDAPVACTIVDGSSDDTEISLVENAMQLPMHPADKFEAFRELADKGMAASDIAARFGVAESSVFKLMKLGRVSPEVMRAYRDDRIEYAQVQAFTISDDHAAQNAVLEMMLTSRRMNPNAIRSELVKDEIPATDKRVRFVGLEFYELCGGAVRRDLFDDQNSGYIQDTALLNQLVDNQLQSAVDALKAEGWKWVEALLEHDWRYDDNFERIEAEEHELPAEEAKKLEALSKEYDACQEQEFDDDGNDNPEVTARLQELEQQIEALQESTKEWSVEQKSIAGVLVLLEHDGSIKIDRGLVKPEDTVASEGSETADDAYGNHGARPKKAKPEFSAVLLKNLTSHRTAALRIELANQPNIALAAVVHALGGRLFYPMPGGNCVKLSGERRYLFPADEPVTALTALENKRKEIALPEKRSEFWEWCLGRSQEELLSLLALCAAHAVDAVQDNSRHNSTSDIVHADQLAVALNLDMRKWFTCTAGGLFNRISRRQIAQAYMEATGEPPSNAVLGLKKKELAIRAERDIGDKWLPSVLRQPVNSVQDGGDDE
jgi:ParB family chromosome partitioning protein